ncbi:MAG: AfsR/SARP family transcriptional regulator, partial [Moorellales bacterium]
MVSMVQVTLLGRFLITAPAGEVVLPTTKVRLLAAYLFWQQGRWVRRELLRGMLWGEFDAERASGNLRTALYFLRRGLVGAGAPPDLLEVRRDALRAPVRPDCVVDVRLFEEKAWAGLRKEVREVEPLVGAASLYRGDFLEDLDADWCLPERRRLN